MAWVGLLMLTGAACVTASAFDPLGDEYSLEGSWELVMEGTDQVLAPSQSNCDTLGVAQVRLVFRPVTGSATFTDPMFTFPCAQGSFDTRSGDFPADDGKVLESDTFYVRYEALDPQGEVIGESPLSKLVLIFEEPTFHDAVAGDEANDIIVTTME